MRDESEGARQETATGAGVFDQPQRAQHRARRRDRQGHHEPAVLSDRGQVICVETDPVVLAFDEPLTDIVQVGRHGDFG